MNEKERRFAEIMGKYGPGLGRIAASYARPADQADLGQEISLAIWDALDRFRGDSSERTFVFRIAHNRALSHIARRRIEAGDVLQIADEAPGPEIQAAGREEVEKLFAVLRSLPVAQRLVLTLALEGMTLAEVGTCLGITPQAAAVRLSRARSALRQRIEAEVMRKDTATRRMERS